MAFGNPYLGLDSYQQAHLIEQERYRQMLSQQQNAWMGGIFGSDQNAIISAPARDQDDDLLLLLTGY